MKRYFLVCAMLLISSVSSAADKMPAFKAAAPASSTSAAVLGPDNAEACAALGSAIEAAEADIAWSMASGVGDNSAARETNRLLTRLLERERQTQHLMMMIALKCPTLPVRSLNDGQRYYGAALRCQTAILGQRAGDTSLPEACQRKNWQADATPNKSLGQ
ncbi:MAG: hypothetical protein EKK53_15240 [Burkholderiales bacterium]|nr:MAG: hypothetical protein EKK53_15240 [Burkholderiales bacterium]